MWKNHPTPSLMCKFLLFWRKTFVAEEMRWSNPYRSLLFLPADDNLVAMETLR